MKRDFIINQGRLFSLTLGSIVLDMALRARQEAVRNVAAISSITLHSLVLVALFVSFSGKSNVLSTEFIPIGVEIADFKAGSLVKNSGYRKKSEKIVMKKSENGENFVKNENSGQAVVTQKSKISKYNQYVELIAHELERRKSRFSMDDAPEDMKVTVIFEVNLDESGNLKSYKMVKNSGNKFFDNVAKKILTCSNSFPTPPSEIKSTGLTFSIPIIFDSMV